MTIKPIIAYPDFEKLDIRIGKIIAASAPDWSNKLLEFRVDFGADIGERTVLSGIRKWYQPEEFINKKYVFLINLAERTMGEATSQGMMLMGDGMIDGAEHPIVFAVPDQIEVGTVVR